jgi:hypothetical protein
MKRAIMEQSTEALTNSISDSRCDGNIVRECFDSPRRYLSGTLTALMLACFAISGWLWLQPLMRTQEAQAVSVDAVRLPRDNSPTRVTRELVYIEDVQLGRRVVGRNPLREQTQLPGDIHPETHRTIRLEMIQYGTLYELAFVRSLTWLSEQQAQAGGMIQLVMTEMGLDGPARVISIEPCPEIEPDDGTGRMVVTGTMKHLAGNLLEIQTADDTEPLGVTDTHPFWSVDRQNFVVAGQLTVGESLEQADGTVTQITRITPTRGPPVMVYNLEIDAEHVFHVGEDGLLVHNSCVTWSSSKNEAFDWDHVFSEDHLRNGIMNAGHDKTQIMQSISDTIHNASQRGLLRAGPNQIETIINGMKVTIRAFFDQQGKLMKINAWPGISARKLGNLINL